MGYMRHHAILVSSWDEKLLAKAHAQATAIFPGVSEIMPHEVNGGGTFLVPPDGSKEGWAHSNDGDDRRATFVRWLNEQRYADGSTSLRWAEVMYADDNDEAAIVRHDGAPEVCDDFQPY